MLLDASEVVLTIIIPVFQRQQGLELALSSILNQRVRPYEVIVVDDGSKPPITIAETFIRLNVRLLRHDGNMGPAAARNSGLAACRTEWCTFLDSDDELMPDTLDARWTFLLDDQARCGDPKVIYGCGWIDILAQRRKLQIRWPRASRQARDFASGCWFSPGSCILINKVAALQSAGYQDTRLRRLEDFDWFLALGLKGFRLRPQPVVGALIERRRTLDPQFVEQNAKLLEQKWQFSSLPPEFFRRVKSYIELECASADFYSGKRRKAFIRLLKSFALHPRLGLHFSPGWQFQSAESAVIQNTIWQERRASIL